MLNEIDYEQLSYGKVAYKRVQRLRKKGKRRGIDIPALGFELTKPDKPRIVFWIAAIVGLVIAAGILVGFGFVMKYAIDFLSRHFKDSGGFLKTIFNPTLFFASAGLTIIPILIMIMAYCMILLMLLIPVIMALYCYTFARNAFYMARCSKEEFAKGEFIWGHIVNFAVVLVVSTVLLIVCLLSTDAQKLKIAIGLVYLGIVIIFGGLLTLLVLEKKKCTKWFDSLPEDKKQNFLEHDKGLRRVKRRLNSERQFWSNFGR